MIPLLLSLLVTTAAALAYTVVRYRYWRKEADRWFNRCMEAETERFRMVPRFDLHPLCHATRNYPSLDALLHSSSPASRERQ